MDHPNIVALKNLFVQASETGTHTHTHIHKVDIYTELHTVHVLTVYIYAR